MFSMCFRSSPSLTIEYATPSWPASGSSNAMHAGFADVGDLEVDDVAHALDVDASGSDVGGHKDLDFAAAKRVHRAVALQLALVSMDGFTPDAILLQM